MADRWGGKGNMALRLRGEDMVLGVRALATSSVLLLLVIAPGRAGADCCLCLGCPVGTPVTCFTTIINNNCPGGCPGCVAAVSNSGYLWCWNSLREL